MMGVRVKLIIESNETLTGATRAWQRRDSGNNPGSVHVRIAAEHLGKVAVVVQETDSAPHLPVVQVAVDVDEEKIFPGLALAGAAFDLGHVQAVPAEWGEGVVEGPHPVGDAEH